MSAPLIIFTKTNRASLFDNLAILQLVEPKDKTAVIADYSPPEHFKQTRSLISSQPKYASCELKFFKLDESDGMNFLNMLSASHAEDFICFKNHAHFRNALLEATFLSARNENLQPSQECENTYPTASQLHPSAIVMTATIFWRALNYQATRNATEENTVRQLTVN